MAVSDPEIKLTVYDREYGLGEVLIAANKDRLQQIFSNLAGENFCVQSVSGEILLGFENDYSRRVAIYLDIEISGYLCCCSNVSDETMLALEGILKMIVATQHQYLMFSSLHIETIHADYAELMEKNAQLQASEQRYMSLCNDLDQRVQAQVVIIEKRQQQLYQSERLSSVGRMAAGVAHEINNPMGFILSNLHTASRYAENLQAFARLMAGSPEYESIVSYWLKHDMAVELADFQALLEENIQGAERIKAVVSSLSGFSDFDLDKSETCNLDCLLRSATDMAFAGMKTHAKMKYEYHDLIDIQCNQANLKRAFFNIMRNALQAISDAGEIAVVASIRLSSIDIQIADNGCGMDAQTLAHAFDPFFTTRQVGQGVGLGLTAAREIIQAHGGTISLSSQPGVGTQVQLTMPVIITEK